jgi:hypothetical protein
LERYKLPLTPRHQQAIVAQVTSERDAVRLSVGSGTEIWAVHFWFKWLAVVYHTNGKCLVTCLPPEVLTPHEGKLVAYLREKELRERLEEDKKQDELIARYQAKKVAEEERARRRLLEKVKQYREAKEQTSG